MTAASGGSSPPALPSPAAGVPGGIYAATVGGRIDPSIADVPERVYVPDEVSGDVVVIDPRTYAIVDRFPVGSFPEHITPDWDLQRLYVNDMKSSRLTIVDPRSGRPTGQITVPSPYNLYFTLDGRKAIVVDDSRMSGGATRNGLYFYDRRTWKLLKFVPIAWPGADHLDMSADGSFLLVSCEYAGRLVRVDTRRMVVTGSVVVGGLPLDVRLSPDGRVFYVANQGLGGVEVVDARTLRVLGLIHTGRGAHGLAISRDATRLYVADRLDGTLAVIDFATRTVTATWPIGGSPDMIAVSPDGTELWVSNRFYGTVFVVNTWSGAVVHVIATGANPHGLTFWPQPGRLSLGHNGNMR